METALQVLMEGLIDYAGLYPPASLDMPVAVRNYAAYRQSGHARWLGRFVVPVSRLGEFAKAFADLGSVPGADGGRWPLSALIGNDLAGDLKAVADFNRSAAGSPAAQAVIDSLEMKVDRAEDILAASGEISAAMIQMTSYFEIPIHDDPSPLLAAIAQVGGRAKVRTGGVMAAAFPSSSALARFIAACARTGVGFKATAGLHHPLRSLRRLTYAPDSAETVMHGFLNVFLAAAFAANGMDMETVIDLLEEDSPQAFSFRDGAMAWHGHRLESAQLQAARRDFAIAFGSCSFEEPQEDLREAGWL